MSMIFNALSGAQAAQAALATNSQNIANEMTPGYTRQGVLLGSLQPSAGGSNAAGTGVAVTSLLRFSDSYQSQQMWRAASSLGQYNASQPYLTQLEKVLSDDTSNINQGLDAFFAALNAASVQSDSLPLREQVLTAADGLARRFTSVQQLLTSQSNAIKDQRRAAVQQVNGFTQDIAALNTQIAAGKAGGLNVSGLLDARDQRIDALSNLVGVQVVEQADGTRNVALKNGQPLVVGADAAALSVDSAGALSLTFANTSFQVQSQGLGGQLGGLQDLETQVLEPIKTSIKELAEGIATQFNTVLAGTAGAPTYDLNGNAAGPKALFNFSGGKLTVTNVSATELAFGLKPASGDGGNLKQLIDLKNQTVDMTGFNSSGVAAPTKVATVMGDVYTQLVGRLGLQSQHNTAEQKTAQTVRDQSEENWKSTSGVNRDEEAINLMQFKQMYEANMKVVAVANQLFDSTLAMVG